ncbi:MAG TPA: type II toxin-antitoxin system RelE/ParE family toxin [Tepidisphaeraceae bacterium]|nr:type II toxin-antitoxin system RelE/ParE family toxin [Tepidisphaeraceae bacterium]
MPEAKVTPRAKLDWDKAYLWYAKLGGHLADRLDRAIIKAIDDAKDHPYRFSEHVPGVRRVLLDDFPYKIIYRMLSENSIEVLAIYHVARDPDRWIDPTRG